MIISGLQKTTLLDYPGHVAATVFLGGCNFRCLFCHNMNIVTDPEYMITKEEVLSFLIKRVNVLDGVCITGGEPTINSDLIDFIRSIKDIKNKNGCPLLVKLDTNGTNPKMLNSLIEDKLVDYIAMDIKTSIDEYSKVCNIEKDQEKSRYIKDVCESIKIIMQSMVEYEFRTTIIKQYHDENTIRKIGETIKGAKAYYLQSFIDSEYVLDHSLCEREKKELLDYCNILKEYNISAYIRGVD